MDDRVRGVSDFSCAVRGGGALSASMTVLTVYGDVHTSVEVNLS